MNLADYLDRLLLRYSGTFTISQPYDIHGKSYPAYGYFFSQVEKYVLVREANLWTQKSYEHILFLTEEELTLKHLEESDRLIRDYMEPEFVLKGEKYPEKEHMYSYLTIAFLCEKTPSKDVLRKLKHYSYDKGYQMNMRGFCQARFIAASMENQTVYSNYAGRKMKELYYSVFDDVNAGKPGLSHRLT
ncbi:MAG: hypothetical protein GX234_09440 [Clostridiales bacterium]|nr:hypothetical protein [Clostridiales bacterium]